MHIRLAGVKVFALIALWLSLAVGMSGCSKQQEPELRIASNVWPGYELLYLARERDYFNNPAVRMVEMPSATVLIQALAAGNVEAACLTLDEVLTARAEGLDLRVVAILDFSMGADALVVKPEINDLADLKGRRIGVEQSAVGAVMLAAVLERAGLTTSDVTLVHMNVNAHRRAYVEGEVDALVTFEPVVSQLIAAGDAERLFDSSQIPGWIIDVIAVRPDALAKSPGAVRAAINGHFVARESYLADPQAAAPIIAERLKIPAAEVAEAYAGIELPDLAQNHRWMSGADAELQQAAQRLAAIMVESKLLPAAPDLTNLIDDGFLGR